MAAHPRLAGGEAVTTEQIIRACIAGIVGGTVGGLVVPLCMWFWASTKPRKYRKPEPPEVKP
jgi:hypothetical protein